MIIFSEMGNADITIPDGGFQDPQLAKLFAAQAVNKATPDKTTPNKTTPITKLQENEHTQSGLPVGANAGGIVGSIVFVLFIAVVFLLRRRQQRMVEIPEMPASIEPQEIQDCRLHELHDPKHVPELPTLPIELDGSVPETN